ncbi:Serine/threonine-protein kinase PknD [Xanthomonas sacchari]|uniref:Protein kinase n=1 Tax=Xanthomonas sacchari TaxID=56458 RepID=A0AA46SVE5_9XANT|nr:serine/threonine-protein kinase [Xanthomonas sacchari]MCW0368325.1 Serine/threonine-protein kinase PknD [Xanthomonas sacchari]MCW0441742.1 Serine/threonine-protein kinase PknD [Xanthomonas sacchari]UYK89298.1 protein kinase [Xanthomonas sacchari]
MTGPLNANDTVGNRYRVMEYHAQGGMQFVYAARDELTGRKVALKTPKNASASKRFRRSARVAAQVNHPNIAKTLDYLVEEGRRYLVEEFIEGSDLAKSLLEYTPFLDPYLAARVFHHVAKGVAAAHHVGVVHRDLKPTNIMISGGYNLKQLKVTDFGVAKMAGDVVDEAVAGGEQTLLLSATAVGALPYMAPETIETPKEVTVKADIWSVGAMIYHLVTGIEPFGHGLLAVNKILAAIPADLPAFVTRNPQFNPLAMQVIELAMSCMKRDPNHRPSADELVLKCGKLCYSALPRETGVVRKIQDHKQWGFIRSTQGDVFFHANCVFGPKALRVGDEVLFTRHEAGGGGAPRAYPVLKLIN